jgi:DNA-binding transcriptional ArsR family regulator
VAPNARAVVEARREGAERIEASLFDLCRSSPAISASGGWFATSVVAERAGVSEGTALTHLERLLAAGKVERRDGRGFRSAWRTSTEKD